jgi:putative endonuclease
MYKKATKRGLFNFAYPDSTMFYVYILHSQRLQKYYVGSTQDVSNRFRKHNNGESRSTRNGVPWELIHAEEFPTPAEAVRKDSKREGRRKQGDFRWL